MEHSTGGSMNVRGRVFAAVFAVSVLGIGVACTPPVLPTGPTPTPTARISAGGATCAVTTAGEVLCWGAGWLGLPGSTSKEQRLAATAVPGVAGATSVDTASQRSLCGGLRIRVVLGREQHRPDRRRYGYYRPEPVQVPGVTGATGVSLGRAHTCAVLGSGQVWCWGANDHGQLGDGTFTDRLSPVQVAGITSATLVATGPDHSCALLAAGAVRCWGAGSDWQLGNYAQDDKPVPVAPIGLPTASVMTASSAPGGASPVPWRSTGSNGAGATAPHPRLTRRSPVPAVAAGSPTSRAVAPSPAPAPCAASTSPTPGTRCPAAPTWRTWPATVATCASCVPTTQPPAPGRTGRTTGQRFRFLRRHPTASGDRNLDRR